MIEECFMAAAMTICFALPTYFLVLPGGNFAVLFLTSVISLADGIGELASRALPWAPDVPAVDL